MGFEKTDRVIELDARLQLFMEEHVWLPATGFWLSGYQVRYDTIENIAFSGHADRTLKIRFSGGSASFNHHAVNVSELGEELRERVQWLEQKQWIQ